MKIGLIQAASQREKNSIMEACAREVISGQCGVLSPGLWLGLDRGD